MQEVVTPGVTGEHVPLDNVSVLDRYEREAIDWARRHGGAVVELNAQTWRQRWQRLQKLGFKRIRPLLGGIDAWIEAGLEPDPPATVEIRVKTFVRVPGCRNAALLYLLAPRAASK